MHLDNKLETHSSTCREAEANRRYDSWKARYDRNYLLRADFANTTDRRAVGVSCRFGWLFSCLIGARCGHYSPCSHAVFRMRLWQASVSYGT